MSKDNKSGSNPPIKMVVKTLGPPVRKKAERRQLNGYTCKECEDYFKSKGLSEAELKKRLKSCSRHRSTYSPPKSPEHFWDTDFPSTPECIRRGYMKVEENSNKRKKQKCDKPLFDDNNKHSKSETNIQ